jgi:myxalamid-type polyketide synthase MxaE and MxaD
MAESLKAKNESVHVIGHGEVNPENAPAFEQLLSSKLDYIRETSQAKRLRVVFLWALDSADESAAPVKILTGKELLEKQKEIYWSALKVSQLLLKHAAKFNLKCAFVTQGGRSLGEAKSERISPSQATLWGLGQVISMEFPELRTVRIDLDPSEKPAQADIENILREIALDQGEDQVAYRSKQRSVARLTRNSSIKMQPERLKSLIRGDACYLVTGGLGGLGLNVMKWLLGHGAKDVVLVGRKAPSGEIQEMIGRTSQAHDARVTVENADISEYQDVAKLMEKIRKGHPPIRGIVHAAGVLLDAGLLQQDWDRFVKVGAPKVAGAWNLHRLTENERLDFCLFFSSATSLIGNKGQANYAAANAFLDAFAFYRKAHGLAATSVNWGPWKEGGMAEQAAAKRQLTESGMELISTEEGLEAFGALLCEQPVQIGVLK